MNSIEDSSLLKKHIQFLDRAFKGSYFEGSEEDFNRSSKNIKNVDPNFSNWINISGKPNPFYSRKNYFEIRYKDFIYLGATKPYILRRDHPFFHIVVEISKKMGFKCHLPTKDIEVSFADTKGDTAFYQKSNATVKISSEISGDRVWPILFHELTHVCQELDDYEDYVTPEKNYFEYLIQKKEVEARIVQGVIYIELNGHSLSDIPYLKISPLDILGSEGAFARIFQEWKELENKDLAIEFSKKFGVSTLKSARCAKKAQELSKEELSLVDYLVLDGADLEKAVDTVIFLKKYKNNDEFKNKKWPYKPKRSLRKKLNVMFKENPPQPEVDDVKNMTLKETQGIYSDPVKEFIRFSKKVERKYGSEIKDPTNPELSKKRKLMLKFLETNGFEEVGEGAYRRVFLSPGGELIKITESDYGLEQNRREITLFNSDRTGIFPKVEEVGMNGEWFIVEKIESISPVDDYYDINPETFQKAFPKFFKFFGQDIVSFFNKGVESEFDSFFKEFENNIKDFNEISKRIGKDKTIERFKTVPYKWKMLEYAKNSDLNFKKLYHAYKTHGLEDLHIGNVFFTKDGDVKVIDAGFTKNPDSGPLLENNILSEGMIRVPEELAKEFTRCYRNFLEVFLPEYREIFGYDPDYDPDYDPVEVQLPSEEYESDILKKYGVNILVLHATDGHLQPGYYNPKSKTAMVYIPWDVSLSSSPYDKSSVYSGSEDEKFSPMSIAYHEFIHALQFSRTKNIFGTSNPKGRAGRFYGLPKKHDTMEYERSVNHAARPIEFYTRLHDSLFDMVEKMHEAPDRFNLKKDLLNFVYDDDFFDVLRRHSPDRFKKALKELYKATTVAYKILKNNPNISKEKLLSIADENFMLDEKDSLNESLQISAFPEWFGDFKRISHAHILDVAKDFLPVENSKYLDHIQSSFTDKQGIFYDEAEACFNELIDYFGDMACVGVPTAIDVEIMESKMYDLERAGGVVNTITETPNTFRVEIFKPTSREFNSTLSGVFFEWIDNKVNAGWIGGTTYSITPQNKESVLAKIKKLANNELRRANNLKTYIDNSRAMIGDIGSSYSHPKQKYRIQRDYDSISVFDANNNLLSSLKIDCNGDCPDIISLGDGNNMSLNMNGLFSDASTYSGRGAMKLDDLYKFFNKFRRSINRTMIRSSRESILDNNSLLFENVE